jgi:ribosomal-protein-alanine N-acetyltransferase
MDSFLLTERLILAPHDESDLDFMVALNSDPEVNRFTGGGPLDSTQALLIVHALQRQLGERHMARLVVLDRRGGERLGWCGLKWVEQEEVADLGYRFFQKWWGRGFATEASRACLRYGFEDLGLTRIIADADRRNARSTRVLEKLGFARRGQNGEVTRWELANPIR